jgi:hypothetical protein
MCDLTETASRAQGCFAETVLISFDLDFALSRMAQLILVLCNSPCSKCLQCLVGTKVLFGWGRLTVLSYV